MTFLAHSSEPDSPSRGKSVEGALGLCFREYIAWAKERGATELLWNGSNDHWIEYGGVLERAPCPWGREGLEAKLHALISHHKVRLDYLSPFANFTLEHGVRMHIVGSALAEGGLIVSLRIPSFHPWTIERWEQEGGALPLEFIEEFREGKNTLVAGGTGSGKTSLLSALISVVSHGSRLLLLEDVAEIRSVHPHCVRLLTRVGNSDGIGAISLRTLLREALRMRPDRLVLGECRGEEAFDLMLAMTNGHRGSICTIHGDSAREALERMRLLVLLGAATLGGEASARLVCGGIKQVAVMRRENGRRKLVEWVDVLGFDGGQFQLRNRRLS
jgi:pilus assembly protein CpaF